MPILVKSILRVEGVLLGLSLEYADYSLIAFSCLDATVFCRCVSILGLRLGSWPLMMGVHHLYEVPALYPEGFGLGSCGVHLWK